jgi:hypothetical protein
MLRAMADITIVKGETPAGDRTWMTMPDGSTQRVAVHVIHDLPHLVVESLFGLDDGLWGVLARGGFATANKAASRRDPGRAKLVTDAEFDPLAADTWPAHRVAKAATNAVTNRWQDGPDTPDGVRARLASSAETGPGPRGRDKRATLPPAADAADHQRRISELQDRLADDVIQQAIDDVRRLFEEWSDLAPGESLRLTWPLG